MILILYNFHSHYLGRIFNYPNVIRKSISDPQGIYQIKNKFLRKTARNTIPKKYAPLHLIKTIREIQDLNMIKVFINDTVWDDQNGWIELIERLNGTR